MYKFLSTIVLILMSIHQTFAAWTEPHTIRGQYALHCMGCHGTEGKGLPPAIPDVTQSFNTLLSTPNGRLYLLQVPGVSRSKLPPQQLANILNWMREQYAPTSNQYPEFTADEIKNALQHPLTDPFAVRRALLPNEKY